MTFKIALLAAALLSAAGLIGCGGDDCTRAEDHKADCMPVSQTSSTGMGDTTLSCSGAYQCQSQCINNFTCPQIMGSDPKYTACIAKCQGQ